MPLFTFEAVDAAGTRVRGTESASTAAVLTTTLEARGLHLLAAREADTANGWAWSFGHRRDVLEFTRAMAALLPAGMPLARALESAAGVTRPAVRQAGARLFIDFKPDLASDVVAARLAAAPKSASWPKAVERALGLTGRVLLRSSGTEPLIRVMVEGRDYDQVENLAKRLADAVSEALAD